MLILSKTHDYYDSVAKTSGVDKTVVFNRVETESIDIVLEARLPQQFRGEDDGGFATLYKFGILGFCGKLYPVCVEHKASDSSTTATIPTITENKVTFIYDHVKIEEIWFKYPRTFAHSWHKKNFLSKTGKKNINDRWNDYKRLLSNTSSLNNIFVDKQVPYFVATDGMLDVYNRFSILGSESYSWKTTLNKKKIALLPSLNDLQFYRVMNPQTAFQEIYMYLSGVLGVGDKPMIKIEDKHKISGHGFDKWSFRKMKETKK